MRVARIFNTFGPRMHMNDGRVVSNFILQALQGEPLTVGASLRVWVEGCGVGGVEKELAVCQQATKEQCLLVWAVTFLRLPVCLGSIPLPLGTRRKAQGWNPEEEQRSPGGLASAWAAIWCMQTRPHRASAHTSLLAKTFPDVLLAHELQPGPGVSSVTPQVAEKCGVRGRVWWFSW